MGSYNDLALVEIDPADVERVNPSVPGFGGPTGVGGVEGLGSTVHSYGNSSLRAGVSKLSPKQGVLIENERQRLEPPGAHRDARHTRRLRQRLPQRSRRGNVPGTQPFNADLVGAILGSQFVAFRPGRDGEAKASQQLLGSLAAASDPARQAGRVGRAAR